MNPFRFLTPIRSAPVARKRLHGLLESDRHLVKQTDLVVILQEELSSVLGHHVTFDGRKVRLKEIHGNAVCSVVIDIDNPMRLAVIAMAAMSPLSRRPVDAALQQRHSGPCA
jgi:septum formation topological specificity factor MinE